MFRIEDWTSADYISWGSDPDADDSDEDMDVDDSDEDMDADDSGEVVWEAPLE